MEWDDDDFELPEFLIERIHIDFSARPTGDDMTSGGGGDNHDTNEAEEWLSSRKEESKKLDAIEKRIPEKKTRLSRDDDDVDVYLTDQFCRLNTPASGKKSRCAICTRPIPEIFHGFEDDTARFCKSCDSDIHLKKKRSHKKQVRFSDEVTEIT